MHLEELREARFVARLNRFVAECKLGRRTIRVHLANSGRLGELLLPGVTLYLAPTGPTATLPFKVFAIDKDGEPVVVESVESNALAERLLRSGELVLDTAPRFDALRREVTHGRSRFDLALTSGGEDVFVEVKSCTLFTTRFAMFPDAATERGTRHVEELTALARSGTRTAILVLVQSAQPEYFLPDYHTDPAFARALHAARGHVELAVYGVSRRARGAHELRRLEVPWSLYEREAGDRGAYVLHLVLDRARRLDVPGLGLVRFDAGHYLYVGEVQAGLRAELTRHARRPRRAVKAIDALVAEARIAASLPIVSRDAIADGIAAGIDALGPRASLGGFGAAPPRLFAFADDPSKRRAFWDVVLHARMDRLLRG
ncbi:DNA/RNA nuclease SfsA [Myxococcota bacterium]|nr:DNA/RNA nuclease SfsA [Myxococcota bacterium]